MTSIRDLTIGLLLFSALAFTATLLFSGIATSTTYAPNSTANYTFMNTTKNVTDRSLAIEQNLRNSKITGIDLLDIPLTIASGAFQAILLIIDTTGSYWSLISDLSGHLNLPVDATYFINIFIAVVAVIVLFEAVSMLIKWKV